jgi:glycosyltransferase involved in cell wall biosynthesis
MYRQHDCFAQISEFNLSYPSLFSAFKINEMCHISVVIPVRNEAENILNTLEAFARQIDSKGQPINLYSFEILILANNCTDNSVDIIRNFQRENPWIPLYLAEIVLRDEDANIGFVRRLLMNEAFNRLRHSVFGEGLIMTTDSDTVVLITGLCRI